MNQTPTFLKLALAALLLSGCQSKGNFTAPTEKTFSTDLPVARLDLPETPGRGAVSVGAEYVAFSRTVITDQRDSPESQMLDHGHSTFHTLIDGEAGISDRFAVGLKLDPTSDSLVPAMLNPSMRYQIFGTSRSNAQRGNFSLSAGIGFLHARSGHDKERSGQSCSLCSDRKYRVLTLRQTNEGLDADLLGGYRLLNNTVLYGGVFHQDIEHNNKLTYIDRGKNPRNIIAQTVNEHSYDIVMSGHSAGLAVDLTDDVSLIAEYLRYQLFRDDLRQGDPEETFAASLRLNL